MGGSSGECIYQNVAERKTVLENVMAVRGKMTIIAHVAATSTRDSVELAKHAEQLGVDKRQLFHQFILVFQKRLSRITGQLW